MAKIKTKNQSKINSMKNVMAELEFIKNQLAKILLLIPQESLDNYKNSKQIKNDFMDAVSNFPPV